jgi:hypothetical protein
MFDYAAIRATNTTKLPMQRIQDSSIIDMVQDPKTAELLSQVWQNFL